MKTREKGFVLVVCLIYLVILTLLSVFMFTGLNTDLKMAGNYREKHRALDAAQAALDYTEIWLAQPGNAYYGAWSTGSNCTAPNATATVCSNALTNPTTTTWPSYTSYVPSGMTVAASGQNTYSSNTKIYIQYMGTTNVNPPTAIYSATTSASGGNSDSQAIVRTVYQVQATAYDISQ